MNKSENFKGKIQFIGEYSSIVQYVTPSLEKGFEEKLCDTMMVSFENLNLSSEEKKHFSRNHRKLINYYRHIDPVALNRDALQLISTINQSDQSNIVILANHYGAYICLAALYSGKLSTLKKIEFILEKAPLALFPESFMKAKPKSSLHKIVFQVSEDCWLNPFSSLYKNLRIKYSLAKTPAKKVA
jgi:hypothetical protein